jgi:HCOMODA/2-hydroxy-3-carboxy-muconic semialdehyde decarboxylase
MVLMRRHGVTAVGTSVRNCVFRCIYSVHNATFQVRAMALGPISSLSPGECKLAAEINTSTTAMTRSWDHWSARLERAGLAVA